MESKTEGVVVGLDGGGTHTRVMVADLAGSVLSYTEKGASSIYKDSQASENVKQAIDEALRQAGKSVSQVQMLAAGIAGFDKESDYEWVQALTDLPGLDCEKIHVNDAVVAHSGALLAEPGVVVISGTGSILYAVTEEGKQIRNYDLRHYAASAARFLAYDATFELLAGNVEESDQSLVASFVQFWGLASEEELRRLALNGFVEDTKERNKKFAQLAPVITQAALDGSKLAVTVCDRAIHQITVGVEMLGAYFSNEEVKVSFIGSVVNSDYFRQQLASGLRAGKNKTYEVVQPALSPVAGSVLLALKQLTIPVDSTLLNRLGSHPKAVSKDV